MLTQSTTHSAALIPSEREQTGLQLKATDTAADATSSSHATIPSSPAAPAAAALHKVVPNLSATLVSVPDVRVGPAVQAAEVSLTTADPK